MPPAYLPSTPFRRFACSYLESHYPRRQTALKPLITVELLPAMLQSAPRNYRTAPNPGSRLLLVYFSTALLFYITQSDDSAISCIFCRPMQHPLPCDALKKTKQRLLACACRRMLCLKLQQFGHVEFGQNNLSKKKASDCTCLSFMVKSFAWSLRDGA